MGLPTRSKDAQPQFAVIDATGMGANAIVALVANRRIRVLDYLIVAAGAVVATWNSDATPISGDMSLAAQGNAGDGAGAGSLVGVMETAEGEALNLNLNAAVSVQGHLTYIVV
jgi:hypothetical protein